MSIITRKVYESWGKLLNDGRKPLPPNIAYIDVQDGQFIGCKPEKKLVTWDEVLQERREKQQEDLECKRRWSDKTEIKPCFVWVFENEFGFPYGGWWCYVKTFKKDFPLNFRNDRKDMKLKVMQLFPSGVLPILENFEYWMMMFQKQYKTKGKRKREGMAMAWAEISNGDLIDIILYKNS